jgi:3,4-dihydroxy 2-butanone 4-phosphate synthase
VSHDWDAPVAGHYSGDNLLSGSTKRHEVTGSPQDKISQAISDLKSGKPMMLYDFDGREEETDLIFYGPEIDARAVIQLRLEAGAPLSVYVDSYVGEQLGLATFLSFVGGLDGPGFTRLKNLAAPAGGFDPRFALTLDHRSNKTGCTHNETANTIRQLAKLILEERFGEFENEFRSPGHVPLIIGAPGLLQTRTGHTELILRIAQIGGLCPLMVASEILDRYTGQALPLDSAKASAALLGLVFLTGEEVMSHE